MLNRSYLRRMTRAASDDIVQLLTDCQHAFPRMSVADVMRRATEKLGCCPVAIAQAIEWLQTDATRPIGRLRRGELLQLARSIHRFWRQPSNESSPADVSY